MRLPMRGSLTVRSGSGSDDPVKRATRERRGQARRRRPPHQNRCWGRPPAPPVPGYRCARGGPPSRADGALPSGAPSGRPHARARRRAARGPRPCPSTARPGRRSSGQSAREDVRGAAGVATPTGIRRSSFGSRGGAERFELAALGELGQRLALEPTHGVLGEPQPAPGLAERRRIVAVDPVAQSAPPRARARGAARAPVAGRPRAGRCRPPPRARARRWAGARRATSPPPRRPAGRGWSPRAPSHVPRARPRPLSSAALATSSSVGSRPSCAASSRCTRPILRSRWPRCTGIRIVRERLSSAR